MSARELAVIHDYDGLLRALRARVVELDTTMEAVDAVAGLPVRYSSKLLASVPIRGLSRMSFGAILGAMGVALIMIEDLSAFEKIRKRLVARTNRRGHASDGMPPMKAKRRRAFSSLLRGDSNWGKLMNARRIAKMTGPQRSRSA